MTTDELITQPTRRDRWGRYLVLPADGGKLTGYTRATTIAKTLDDGGGLINWRSRMVAIGLAGRPDLVALAATTDNNDKKTLDDICERAAEAGGATARRDLGTALHAMLEQSWVTAGYQAPDPYAADVAAVHSAMERAGLSVVAKMHERIVVNDRHQIAGTFDLIVTDGTANYVADIKTGSSLLGALGFSIQLAIYANADALYTQGAAADGSQDLREPMPALNVQRGVILHVQPGSGRCDLHWIDLELGARALELAMTVRDIRKAKPLSPVAELPVEQRTKALVEKHFPGAVDVTVIDDERRQWLRDRLARLIDNGLGQILVRRWPVGVPKLKTGEPITLEQCDELVQIVAEIEAEADLPFFDPILPEPAPAKVVKITKRPKIDDADGEVDEATIAEINAAAAALDASARAWVAATISAAGRAGRPIRLMGTAGVASARRAAIARALIVCATFDDDDLVRALVGLAMGDDELQPAIALPIAIGSLTLDEAQRLERLAAAVAKTDLVPTWNESGVVITGDITAALAA